MSGDLLFALAEASARARVVQHVPELEGRALEPGRSTLQELMTALRNAGVPMGLHQVVINDDQRDTTLPAVRALFTAVIPAVGGECHGIQLQGFASGKVIVTRIKAESTAPSPDFAMYLDRAGTGLVAGGVIPQVPFPLTVQPPVALVGTLSRVGAIAAPGMPLPFEMDQTQELVLIDGDDLQIWARALNVPISISIEWTEAPL